MSRNYKQEARKLLDESHALFRETPSVRAFLVLNGAMLAYQTCHYYEHHRGHIDERPTQLLKVKTALKNLVDIRKTVGG